MIFGTPTIRASYSTWEWMKQVNRKMNTELYKEYKSIRSQGMKTRDDYKMSYEQAKTSRPKAVRMHCLECCGFDREMVKTCPSENCALFEWRLPSPGTDKARKGGEKAAMGRGLYGVKVGRKQNNETATAKTESD